MGMGVAELDEVFERRSKDIGRITVVVDEGVNRCVGYVALLEIDWERGVVGDMSLRVELRFCGRGIGGRAMGLVGRWCLRGGLNTLRLSVAASNVRAVRCYEKAGFVRQEEFWRADAALSPVMLAEERYDFLREHAKVVEGEVWIRFWWMELADKLHRTVASGGVAKRNRSDILMPNDPRLSPHKI